MGQEVRITWFDLPVDLKARMVGPRPPKTFVSNGCSCAPDCVLGADLRPACHWHDYLYQHVVKNAEDRRLADGLLYQNIYRCCYKTRGDRSRPWYQRLAGYVPGFVAGLYFRRVRAWGELFCAGESCWSVVTHLFTRPRETWTEWRRARREVGR